MVAINANTITRQDPGICSGPYQRIKPHPSLGPSPHSLRCARRLPHDACPLGRRQGSEQQRPLCPPFDPFFHLLVVGLSRHFVERRCTRCDCFARSVAFPRRKEILRYHTLEARRWHRSRPVRPVGRTDGDASRKGTARIGCLGEPPLWPQTD